MRTPHFWLLMLVYVFTGLGSFLVALHQLAFAVTIGFDKLYAAEVLGLGAFLSLPGVIITGWMSDYIGSRIVRGDHLRHVDHRRRLRHADHRRRTSICCCGCIRASSA